jgi:hypothetical protein
MRPNIMSLGVGITIIPQKGEERNWLWNFVLSLWTETDWTQKESPAVLASNSSGQTRLLFPTSTFEEAIEKSERVRRELGAMSLQEWCEYYSVPLEWAQSEYSH